MNTVSLVVATYNGAKKIPLMLQSLTEQTLDKALWNVVIVNNNSSDNTAEVVHNFMVAHTEISIKLVDEPQQGLSFARNRGIDESDGEYIVIIDDDEIACPNLLAEYLEFLNTHPHAVAAGGKITPHYPSGRPKWLSHITERPIAGTLDLGSEVTLFPEGKYFGGGNMGLRRKALERYGKFNTNLGRRGNKLLGGEEKELYARYHSSGESVYYLPKAEILHVIDESRLTLDYFKAVCYRIGQSERVRTLSIGRKAYNKRVAMEVFKWGASFVIGLYYLLSLQAQKIGPLLIMRAQISRGLNDDNIEKEL